LLGKTICLEDTGIYARVNGQQVGEGLSWRELWGISHKISKLCSWILKVVKEVFQALYSSPTKVSLQIT